MDSGQHEVRDGMLVIRRAEDKRAERAKILALIGELDLANAETLAAELAAAENEDGTITLDMSELEFIDSTGIALLVATHRRLNGNGEARFRLVESRATSVCQVLQLTGVDTALPFVSAA